MKVKWLGHSSFLITAADGTRIITDPYCEGMGLSYGAIAEAADIVTVGHKHPDHDNVSAVKGKPLVVDATGSKKVKNIEFKGIVLITMRPQAKKGAPIPSSALLSIKSGSAMSATSATCSRSNRSRSWEKSMCSSFRWEAFTP